MIYTPKWTTYYRMVSTDDAKDEEEAKFEALKYVEKCIAPRQIETWKAKVTPPPDRRGQSDTRRISDKDWWQVVFEFKPMPEEA